MPQATRSNSSVWAVASERREARQVVAACVPLGEVRHGGWCPVHLAPVVGAVAGHKYVHIRGHRGVIESLASKRDAASNDAGYFQWIFEVEDHQRILEHMANMLAGPVRR
jgi:hypothetical protein